MKLLKNEEFAILILSTIDRRYENFVRAIENSWVKKFQENGIKCFFYSGGVDHKTIVGNQILLNCPDDLAHTSVKFRLALEVLLGLMPNVKLVYRTNLSSYIDYENLINFIEAKGIDEDGYLGVKGEAGYLSEYFYDKIILHNLFKPFKFLKKIYFASGSGFFLGSNHFGKIIQTNKYDKFIDDVMLGLILNRNFSQVEAPCRFDIQEDLSHKISREEYLSLVKDRFLFHYRFKTSNRVLDAQLIAQFSDPDFRMMTCTLND